MLNLIHRWLKIPYELHIVRYGDWSDPKRPVIVLIHGIGVNHRVWHELFCRLDDQPVIAVDLLGFGASQKPDWLKYTLTDHAKALHKTLRRHAAHRPLILCGHSLGTLISIEYATRFPRQVNRLVLCSPPIYQSQDIKSTDLRELTIKMIGQRFLQSVESSPQLVSMANQYRLTQRHFMIDPDNLTPYTKTARNSILMQTSYDDILRLDQRLPISILYGTLDTVMVPANLMHIAKQRPLTTVDTVLCGHEMRPQYMRRIATELAKKPVI